MIRANFPFRFHIGHVNHGWRGRHSDGDEIFVKKLASDLGWPFHSVALKMNQSKGNLEERAREGRYKALCQMAVKRKCPVVMTAHTCDDQAETVFINFLRGTGPKGLSGMASLRPLLSGKIILARPFLKTTKEDIRTFLNEFGFPCRVDASNRNLKFLRNWLRTAIFPQLEKRAPGFQLRLENLSNLWRDEELYWEKEMAALKRKLVRSVPRGRLLDFKGVLRYSPAVQRRLLRSIVGEDVMTFEGVEGLRRWMTAPPTSGRRWMLKQGWIAERLSKSKGSPSASLFLLGQFPLGQKRKNKIHEKI
jgi:tRNA(Ile)-lysidine synthase